jgi:hypothetical protein
LPQCGKPSSLPSKAGNLKMDGFRKKSGCGVALHPLSLRRTPSTPHSSGFARLACGAFYKAVDYGLFFDFLRVHLG